MASSGIPEKIDTSPSPSYKVEKGKGPWLATASKVAGVIAIIFALAILPNYFIAPHLVQFIGNSGVAHLITFVGSGAVLVTLGRIAHRLLKYVQENRPPQAQISGADLSKELISPESGPVQEEEVKKEGLQLPTDELVPKFAENINYVEKEINDATLKAVVFGERTRSKETKSKDDSFITQLKAASEKPLEKSGLTGTNSQDDLVGYAVNRKGSKSILYQNILGGKAQFFCVVDPPTDLIFELSNFIEKELREDSNDLEIGNAFYTAFAALHHTSKEPLNICCGLIFNDEVYTANVGRCRLVERSGLGAVAASEDSERRVGQADKEGRKEALQWAMPKITKRYHPSGAALVIATPALWDKVSVHGIESCLDHLKGKSSEEKAAYLAQAADVTDQSLGVMVIES